jgi:hypothetical protein
LCEKRWCPLQGGTVRSGFSPGVHVTSFSGGTCVWATVRWRGGAGLRRIICQVGDRLRDGGEVGGGIFPPHREYKGERDKLYLAFALREKNPQLRDVRSRDPNVVETIGNVDLGHVNGAMPRMGADDAM